MRGTVAPAARRYASRSVTLPDPIRGYAGITWDTRTLKSLIDAMGGAGASAPVAGSYAPASHTHASLYPPSALQYYLETNNGNGASIVQTINSAVWTRLNVAGTVATNNGGGFSAASDIYTIPGGGIYVAQALVRVTDGFGTNCNLGIGWHTSESDGYWFQWNKYVTGSGGRCSLDYTRAATWNAGDQCRLYAFQDSGFNMDITALNLSVWRIG